MKKVPVRKCKKETIQRNKKIRLYHPNWLSLFSSISKKSDSPSNHNLQTALLSPLTQTAPFSPLPAIRQQSGRCSHIFGGFLCLDTWNWSRSKCFVRLFAKCIWKSFLALEILECEGLRPGLSHSRIVAEPGKLPTRLATALQRDCLKRER